MKEIHVRLNGTRHRVRDGMPLIDLLICQGEDHAKTVIRNGHPVRLPEEEETPLAENDRITTVGFETPESPEVFYDLLTARHSPELPDRFQSATVGVAGCGGLGSHVAVALARSGIGSLVLADHDRVDPTNLNRQHYERCDVGRFKVVALKDALHRFNPFVNIRCHRDYLTADNILDVFPDCDVVVEAFDSVESKQMIVKAFSRSEFRERHLITASGLAGIYPANSIQTRQLATNIVLCGDLVSAAGPGNGLMAPRVLITAGHQANAVLRILSGMDMD